MTVQPMMQPGLMLVIVALVMLASLAGLIWLWWRVLRRPAATWASCGGCNYNVTGLTTMMCPECGGDFRTVGIKTSRPHQPVGWLMFLSCWTLLLLVPVSLMHALAMRQAPKVYSTQLSVELIPDARTPQSVRIHASFDGRPTRRGIRASSTWFNGQSVSSISTLAPLAAPPRRIVLSQSPGPTGLAPPMLIDTASAGFEYKAIDGSTIRGADLTGDDLAGWVEHAEQTVDEKVRSQLAILIPMIEQLQQGNLAAKLAGWQVTTTNHVVQSRNVGWYQPALIAGWLTLYCLGLIIFAFCRRRSRTRSQATTAPDQRAVA